MKESDNPIVILDSCGSPSLEGVPTFTETVVGKQREGWEVDTVTMDHETVVVRFRRPRPNP